jgi:hypothetical protein
MAASVGSGWRNDNGAAWVQRQTGEKGPMRHENVLDRAALGLPYLFPAVPTWAHEHEAPRPFSITSFGSFPMKSQARMWCPSSYLACRLLCQTFYVWKKL